MVLPRLLQIPFIQQKKKERKEIRKRKKGKKRKGYRKEKKKTGNHLMLKSLFPEKTTSIEINLMQK